jgi:nitrite reductase (NADH) small subunit
MNSLNHAQWKFICKVAEIPVDGIRLVERGLAWQGLPAVELHRTGSDGVYAVLTGLPDRHYAVLVQEGLVYLDVNELNAPASRAEAALAGAYGVTPRVL